MTWAGVVVSAVAVTDALIGLVFALLRMGQLPWSDFDDDVQPGPAAGVPDVRAQNASQATR
jgi:hypothetical protein